MKLFPRHLLDEVQKEQIRQGLICPCCLGSLSLGDWDEDRCHCRTFDKAAQ